MRAKNNSPEKIVRDGLVAVAVSRGRPFGWSTEIDVDPMDARFNQLFLDGKVDEVQRICKEENLGPVFAKDVEIKWVPVGTQFYIDPRDFGEEYIMTFAEFDWLTA